MNRILTIVLAFTILFSTNLFSQKGKGKDKKQEDKKHYLDTLGIGLDWRSVGPAVTSGRIADFAVHPQKHSTYYVATASGGVWKTTNAGTTYEPIFDGEGSYSIGCVTLDPSNPNTVWVGTGENNNQRSVAYGDGIYKSNDGGGSWQHMGLKESEHIGKIIVDPRNSDVVWVAAIGPLWSKGGDRGLYKSTDGGATWEQVLKNEKGESLLDEHTGVTDIIMDPRNPDVVYAAAFQRRRHVFTYVGGGPGSTIYKTTDGGATWEKAANGLPGVDIGRIGLAISPADPEVLYAIVEAAQGKGGFFKSTDRGASWKKQSGHSTSGNYYMEIYCHPTDPDIVYSMNTWNMISRDGGKSFQRLGEEFKHVDNHIIWIDPTDTQHLLAGCDGGVYESFDHAKTWDFKANLPVTQFYKVEVDNAEPFYNIYGGTQDNYSLGGPSRTRNGHGIANDDWFVTQLGDGFESAIDPDDPNIVYAQYQYGGLTRYDKASGEMTAIQPQPREDEDAYRWNWDAPLQTSAHVPKRIYFAANKLFRSDDRGDTWQVISGDLTRQIDRNTLPVMGRIQSIDAVMKNRSTSEFGTIVAFCESPKNANLLYVGTDDGLVQITEDGGQTWTKISSFPGVPDMTYVNMLLASQHDENTVYACFNNHKRGDFKPYVFKSSDKGRTWKNISSNLPKRGSSYSIAEDHVVADLLFVGTEFSCFFTRDGGGHWKKLANGLPTVAVRDIAVQRRENDLVLATFGRSFYVMDDYSPLRKLTENELAKEADIFPIKDGLLFIKASPLGYTTGKGFQGHSFYTADNPPIGVTFSYFIKNKIETLKAKRRAWEKKQIKDGKDIRYPTYDELQAERNEEKPYLLFTIRNGSGQIVRQIKTGVKKGVNRLVWDGRYPSKDPVSLSTHERAPWESPDGGGFALPGDYTVALSKVINGKETKLVDPQPFKLKTLGGSTLPATDKTALDNYIQKAAEMERAFGGASSFLGEMNDVVKYIRKAAYSISEPAPDLLADVKSLENKLKDLRKTFYGDGVATALDKPQKPSLSSRVYGMSYEVWSSTSAPTSTQKEQQRIAAKILKTEIGKLRKLAEVDLKNVEKKLDDARAPYTPGRLPVWSGN
ncbi:MAG TPA: glycosyl hydrolase [Bacteroidetes bacterium]|nr:glycosyl hydrolase [Bacteroidota bacterium]